MAITITPSTQFVAVLEGAASGLVGSVGVRVVKASDDSIVLARTTSGISETVAGSGTYDVTLTSPSDAGEYVIVWDDGGSTPADFATEPLTVGGVAPPPSAPAALRSNTLRLPHANATVTLIEARSAAEDWDRSASATSVWTGSADAYIQRSTARTTDAIAAASDVTSSQVLLVPRLLPVEIGSRITYTTRDGQTVTLRVASIDYRTPPPGVSAPIAVTGELV